MRRLWPAALLLLAALTVPATAQVTCYLGGEDFGLDLLLFPWTDVYAVPGGCLDVGPYVQEISDAGSAEIAAFEGADPAILAATKADLALLVPVKTVEASFQPTRIHDPNARVWLESYSAYTEVPNYFIAAQYLRAKAPAIRAAWEAFVDERGLALTGWGVLLVEFRDGGPAAAIYQPYDSPAYQRAMDFGLFGEADEYSDHPEANGIAEWSTLEGRAPTIQGDFILGFALKLD